MSTRTIPDSNALVADYGFQGDTGTGLKRLGAGEVAIISGGQVVARFGGSYMGEVQIRVPLAAVATAGGAAAIQNPLGRTAFVAQAWIDVTTASTGSCNLDIGTAANGTTSADNLIDGVQVNAIGVYNTQVNAGTNGGRTPKITATQWITVSQSAGAIAGLAGFLYVRLVVA